MQPFPATQAETVRTRQHVNPLKATLQVPLEVADWATVFADPRLPLAIDVGCGSGRFMLSLARRLPGYNLLGLDIRAPVRFQVPEPLNRAEFPAQVCSHKDLHLRCACGPGNPGQSNTPVARSDNLHLERHALVR